MMKNKLLLILGLTVGMLHADMLSDSISMRANGLAGAFTAISNDSSALMFNPAGLVEFERGTENARFLNFTLGVQLNKTYDLRPEADAQNNLSNSYDGFFAASERREKYGLGIGVYTMDSFIVPIIYDVNTTHLGVKHNVFAFGGATQILPRKGSFGPVSVGATANILFNSHSSFDFMGNFAYIFNYDGNNSFGWSAIDSFASIGSKGRLFQNDLMYVDFGVSYRTQSALDRNAYPNTVHMWNVPAKLSFGLATYYDLNLLGPIVVSFDYDISYYNNATQPSTEITSQNSTKYVNTLASPLADIYRTAVGIEFLNYDSIIYRIGYFINQAGDVGVKNESNGVTLSISFLSELNYASKSRTAYSLYLGIKNYSLLDNTVESQQIVGGLSIQNLMF